MGGWRWPTQLDCEGVHFVRIPVKVLDGTRASGDPYTAQFLATLTSAEITTILSYHPLFDPPGARSSHAGDRPALPAARARRGQRRRNSWRPARPGRPAPAR